MKTATVERLFFTVPGDAVSFATKNTVFYRGSGDDKQQVRGTRKTQKAADWEYEVQRLSSEASNGLFFTGPVAVYIRCWFALPKSQHRKREPRPEAWKTTKPDIDKIARLVLDALTGVVYVGDQQVVILECSKLTARQGEPGKTDITVCKVPESSVDIND